MKSLRSLSFRRRRFLQLTTLCTFAIFALCFLLQCFRGKISPVAYQRSAYANAGDLDVSTVNRPKIFNALHICYTPEETPEQLGRMARSMFSVLAYSKVTDWPKITFHIFGDALPLNTLDDFVNFAHLGQFGPRLVIYRNSTGVVIKDRSVHSQHKKLEKPEVYVRFYIPYLIDHSVETYLYLDTDTLVLGEIISLYEKVNLREWVMAAGVQLTSVCTLGKMLDLSDARLLQSGIKHNDECMSGGAFFVNKTRWISEERTAKWEYWVRQNAKRKLYYLGCMPPQMIVFHQQWQHLSDEIIMDMKGRECCHRGDFALEPGILHPVKTVQNNTALFEQIHGEKEILRTALRWEQSM